MRVKEGMILTTVMDDFVVVDVSGAFSGMVKLNGTSALIWEGVAAGESVEQIAARLVQRFAVSPEKAAEDVAGFCRAMVENGMFEP